MTTLTTEQLDELVFGAVQAVKERTGDDRFDQPIHLQAEEFRADLERIGFDRTVEKWVELWEETQAA